jgi:hypothetical protein
MKRLLLSTLLIGVVSLGAFAATRAYFSDQEAILGNQINTSFLEIKLDGLDGSVYHNSMKFPQTLAPGLSTRWASPSGGTRILGLDILVAPDSMMPNHYEAKFVFNNFVDGYPIHGTPSNKSQYTRAVEVIELHSQTVPGWAYTDLLNQIDDSQDGVLGFRSLYDLERSIIDNIPVGANSTTLRFEFRMDADAGNQFQGDSIMLDLYIGAAQDASQDVL